MERAFLSRLVLLSSLEDLFKSLIKSQRWQGDQLDWPQRRLGRQRYRMAREKQLQCSPVTCTRRSWTLQWSAASSGRAWSGDAYAMVVEINCSSLVPRAGRIRRRCPPPAPAPGPSPSEPPRAASNGGASRRICVKPPRPMLSCARSRLLARRARLTVAPPASPHLTPLPDVWRGRHRSPPPMPGREREREWDYQGHTPPREEITKRKKKERQQKKKGKKGKGKRKENKGKGKKKKEKKMDYWFFRN
jgi:hypothetical protein